MSPRLKRSAKLLGIGLIVLFCVTLFPHLHTRWLGWYTALDDGLRLVVDLIGISFIAFLFAVLLAPLEALGWWAGWYGDGLKTVEDPEIVERPVLSSIPISRYVIYLEGIDQVTFNYSPNVEKFLEQLMLTLPDDVLLIRGIMPYSPINRPLTEDRLLSFYWRRADYLRASRSGGLIGSIIGFTINVRNLVIVTVSADQRYGPIYNQEVAQVIYNSLINHGYQPSSGVPITFIGDSGGGQIAMGAAPFLKPTLDAPIDVISLCGVFSGNMNLLKLEHVYHLVGDKDSVERVGLVMFPRRWRIWFLSYWNRAKRMGKVSLIRLGPVTHNGVGGPLDDTQFLPDGRSHRRQTLDLVSEILKGDLPFSQELVKAKPSNYELYQQAAFNRPAYYPLNQSVSPELYQPLAPWMGRLILPKYEQRQTVKGALFEVHHTPPEHQHLVGQIVTLRWSDDPEVQKYMRVVTKDVYFSAEAEYGQKQGNIHPVRLNHWRQVDPLESLAGARPNDDVIVMLQDPVVAAATLFITHEPVQITGRFYGLVKILQPVREESDQFRVVHFNRASRQFDGVEEVVRFPQVIVNRDGIFPSTNQDIEKSPLNSTGWYIYGAKDSAGMFVVQAIAPRALFQLQPDEVIFGKKSAIHYIKKQSWQATEVPKGTVKSVLLPSTSSPLQEAVSQWQEGDYALLLHVYGGIGGNKTEPAARGPVYFGHFAFGVARVVREPLTDELRFDIKYHQVYTQNCDGLISGALDWTCYMGDRQYGRLGVRPICDILIKLDAFTEEYDFGGIKRFPLDRLVRELEIMTARYRIGDGTGGTYIGPANNCAQDSNQAMYAALNDIKIEAKSNPNVRAWLQHHPEQARRVRQLVRLRKSLKRKLLPFGTARADWEHHTATLGSSLEDSPLTQVSMALLTWRTILPHVASNALAEMFLQQGASVWVLRTNQVGGYDPDIAAIAPISF